MTHLQGFAIRGYITVMEAPPINSKLFHESANWNCKIWKRITNLIYLLDLFFLKKKNSEKEWEPIGGGIFFIKERVGTHQQRCLWAEENYFLRGSRPQPENQREWWRTLKIKLLSLSRRFAVLRFSFWMRRFCFFCRIESVWGSRATGRRGVGGTTERDTFAFEGEK